MNAHVSDQPPLPFNPAMLRWAREERELSIEEAARRANVRPDVVAAWEAGNAVPTVRQGRILSHLYQRSFLEFFRADPPPVTAPKLVPDFRMHQGAPRPRETRDLRDLQALAEEIRVNALDLFEINGDPVPTVPEALHASLKERPEDVAARTREAIGFSVAKQIDLDRDDREALPKLLRQKIETAAILVLRLNELRDFGARGLCLAADPLPVIIFSSETVGAQMFTLGHELGHVCLGESAISGPPADVREAAPGMKVEHWCNQFAAAFLVPAEALAQTDPQPHVPQASFDDDRLSFLANRFGVSQHAMLLRLVDLRYVEADFYWNVKRAQFLAREAAFRGGGRSKYYGSRYRAQRGDLYTSLVLEAWDANRITNHNAAEFMGTKSFKHLEDIRHNFGDG